MRRLFALPALFAIALIAPVVGVVSPASAANGSGPVILSGPPDVITATTATFTFDASIQGRTCTLDSILVACTADPWTTSRLSVGQHQLTVAGFEVTYFPPVCPPLDPTNCFTPPPVSNPVNDQWNWKVVGPPTAALASPTKPFQLGTSATLSWRTTTATGAPAVSGVQLSTRRAGIKGVFGTPSIRSFTAKSTKTMATLKPGDTDCFQVRATDASGTTGPWSTERCVSLPLDDRATTASKGWKRTRSSSAYNGTLTTATSAHRTLTKTGVRAARVGIVATTCRTCGKVTVKIGTKTIGTLNLHSATTKHRQLLLLPPFAPRSGKLTLTTTSARMVQIDGVALSAK